MEQNKISLENACILLCQQGYRDITEFANRENAIANNDSVPPSFKVFEDAQCNWQYCWDEEDVIDLALT